MIEQGYQTLDVFPSAPLIVPKRAKQKQAAKATETTSGREPELQIIGGQFRGRKLLYHGDPVTRPMKHRVREAIFNLIGTDVAGKHAIDVFAGTGALGLEALSRGAAHATFIERHIPTARTVRENIARLSVEERSTLLETSAFLWSKRDLPDFQSTIPWLVFTSPPYAFYVDRRAEMIELIAALIEHASAGSVLVVESDERFDFADLPGGVKQDRSDAGWDVREYPPARVGVWRKA
jgi:16S rRNA (guanine966-N2)-methyltransferase